MPPSLSAAPIARRRSRRGRAGGAPSLAGTRRALRGGAAAIGVTASVVAVVARRHPRWTAALVCLLAIAAAGYLIVRDTGLSRVRRVEIVGVAGQQDTAIEAALIHAAHEQSTLDVNVGALRAAVAPFDLVRSIAVRATFPHTLRIVITEQLPVARLEAGGMVAIVAADGTVLAPTVRASAMPIIDVPVLPVGRVVDTDLLHELAVLGAAPIAMLHRVARIYSGPYGLSVTMHNGLLIIFGDASLPHAKWISAARVIASPLAAGATYVDVRVPDHPAAGGLTGTAATTGTETPSNGASIVSSIAAALAQEAGISTVDTPGVDVPPSDATSTDSPTTDGTDATDGTTADATAPTDTTAPTDGATAPSDGVTTPSDGTATTAGTDAATAPTSDGSAVGPDSSTGTDTTGAASGSTPDQAATTPSSDSTGTGPSATGVSAGGAGAGGSP